MRPTLHVIPWPDSGRLAVFAHPRGGSWLPDEMTGLADAGVDVLVSALTPSEEERLRLAGEAEAARAVGLRYVAFPIPDRGVPPVPETVTLAIRLAAEIRAGRSVAIHCFAGIGRSAVLAGATLVVLGVAADEALRLIAGARGLPVPDTREQAAWVHAFADGLTLRS